VAARAVAGLGRRRRALLACGFFLCLTVLAPLAAGGDPADLKPVAGGISLDGAGGVVDPVAGAAVRTRFRGRALDLIALGPAPLELVVIAKAKAQWLAVGWPLAVTAPVAAITLGLPPSLAPLTALAALIGGLGFALTGALGAALALGSKRGGLLIAVVVLPLFIPPVVFGAGASHPFISRRDDRRTVQVSQGRRSRIAAPRRPAGPSLTDLDSPARCCLQEMND
jgi:heme exporter protein B